MRARQIEQVGSRGTSLAQLESGHLDQMCQVFRNSTINPFPPNARKPREAISVVASGEVHFALNASHVTAFAIEMAMEP